ncbi:GNAT family N-acetyltransferase [bacterium]|nr:GNAT family N-acetyltransferase [bacterium]
MADCYKNGHFSIREVTDLETFRSLREQWNSLAEQQVDEVPFLCHEWFELWLKHFLGQDRLHILLLHRDDKLVAIVPLYISNTRFKSVPVKMLSLIGNAYSPLRDIISGNADGACRFEYFHLIIDYLTKHQERWDILDVGPFSEPAISGSGVEGHASRKSLQTMRQMCCENWFLEGIAYSGDDYLASRSKNFRKELRKRMRRLEEEGTVDIHIVTHDDNMDRLMDDYYGVYGSSWKQAEHLGPNFHRELAKLAARKGWLRLGFIRVAGVPRATSYAIASGKTGYILKSAYDLEMKSFGLGTLMRIEMIRSLIDNDGVTCIDLGPGEEAYKQTFVSEMRDLQSVIVFNRGVKGTLLAGLCNNVLPAVRRFGPLNTIKKYLAARLHS